MRRIPVNGTLFNCEISFTCKTFYNCNRITGMTTKIKQFASHTDFIVHEIPWIKHTRNAQYPIKHFSSYSILRGWVIENLLYLGMKHFAYVLYVEFHSQRNLCDKQSVLFYGHPRIFQEFHSTISFSNNQKIKNVAVITVIISDDEFRVKDI